MLPRKLIVGLGHSGPTFQKIRHNIGKYMLQSVARQMNLHWTHRLEAAGSYVTIQNHRDGLLTTETILYVPAGLINSSGYNVKRALEFFDFNPFNSFQTMIVIHDEMQLKLGSYKFVSPERSLKGHNGLKSIQNAVGKCSFSRLKVGIGRPQSKEPNIVGEYVMEQFRTEEINTIEKSVGGVIYALISGNQMSMREATRVTFLK